jgi:hypothetical protein
MRGFLMSIDEYLNSYHTEQAEYGRKRVNELFGRLYDRYKEGGSREELLYWVWCNIPRIYIPTFKAMGELIIEHDIRDKALMEVARTRFWAQFDKEQVDESKTGEATVG